MPEDGVSPAGAGEPDRRLAFEVLCEVTTRVGYVPLLPQEGVVREALHSLQTLERDVRRLTEEHRLGESGGRHSEVATVLTRLREEILRPFLRYWHPLLQEHEEQRPAGLSPVEHERAWHHDEEFRNALADLRSPLAEVVEHLHRISGTDLWGRSAAAPRPMSGHTLPSTHPSDAGLQ